MGMKRNKLIAAACAGALAIAAVPALGIAAGDDTTTTTTPQAPAAQQAPPRDGRDCPKDKQGGGQEQPAPQGSSYSPSEF
jgi:hypothetical protein